MAESKMKTSIQNAYHILIYVILFNSGISHRTKLNIIIVEIFSKN